MTAPTSSTTATAARAAATRDEAQALTPTIRERFVRARLWTLIAGATVIGVVLTVLLQGLTATSNDRFLDPTSPKPKGTKAIVEVLRSHGVGVELTTSLDATGASIGSDAASTTLVLNDASSILVPSQLERLRELGVAHLVLLGPSPAVLDGIGAPIVHGGIFSSADGATMPAGAACHDPIATNAPEVTQTGGQLYELAPGVTGAACYETNSGHALASVTVDGTTVTALGAGAALTNLQITQAGNAAMGLGVLGDAQHLVWYEPGYDDAVASGTASGVEQAVPAWLTPAMLLGIAAVLAVMVWRGRRFGPLVFERLPVVVPASETMDGRARLYARTGSRLRALDNLRMGTIARLAALLGLSRATPAHEVALAVADTVARPRDEVLAILIEATPGSDTELVELSDHLLRLEQACAEALGRTPRGRRAPDTTAPPASERGDA